MSIGGSGVSGSILCECSEGVRCKFVVRFWHASIMECSMHGVIEWYLINVYPFLVISEVGGGWTKKRQRSSSFVIIVLMMV